MRERNLVSSTIKSTNVDLWNDYEVSSSFSIVSTRALSDEPSIGNRVNPTAYRWSEYTAGLGNYVDKTWQWRADPASTTGAWSRQLRYINVNNQGITPSSMPGLLNWSSRSTTPLQPVFAGDIFTKLNVKTLAKFSAAEVNYSVALAEARSTARTVAKLTTDLIQSLLLIRKGKFGDGIARLTNLDLARASKSIIKTRGGLRFRKQKNLSYDQVCARRWLEFTYGIRPTVNDIQGMLRQLKDGINQPLVAFNKATSDDNFSTIGTDYYTGANTVTSESRTSKMSLTASLSTGALASTLQSTGLSKPALTAWELVPFSFVVDWILPIGEVLQAIDAYTTWDFSHGYQMVFTKVKWSSARHSVYPSREVTQNSFAEAKAYEIRPVSKFPLPMLYCKNPLSTSHVVTALSLVSVLRRSKRSGYTIRH